MTDHDPHSPDEADTAAAKPTPAPTPSAPFAWAAGALLTDHINACAEPPGTARGDRTKENDERRYVVLGMLTKAWEANPYLTLGQVLDQVLKAAGSPDLDKASDVALIYALAEAAQPVEPF